MNPDTAEVFWLAFWVALVAVTSFSLTLLLLEGMCGTSFSQAGHKARRTASNVVFWLCVAAGVIATLAIYGGG